MSGQPSTTSTRPIARAEARLQNSRNAHPPSGHALPQPLPSHAVTPPPQFTAANSFGPYLFEGQTTNRPSPQFLGSLRSTALDELDVPNYLFANRDHAPNLASGSTTVDAFRYYLCASLARHHGYRKAYLLDEASASPTSSAAMPLYHRAYEFFTTRFAAALLLLLLRRRSTPRNGTAPPATETDNAEQSALVDLERALTRASFSLWPDLFARSFAANAALLSSLQLRAPALLHVLLSRAHPLLFLRELRDELGAGWIDLGDVRGRLRRGGDGWGTWVVLERRRWELGCRFEGWMRDVRGAVEAFGNNNNHSNDVQGDATGADADPVRDANWQAQVERLRDRGVGMAGEAVTVWDDVLDGWGLAGWRRGLAEGLVGFEETGRGWSGGLGGGGRAGRRARAGGVENADPGWEREGEGWDPEAPMPMG